MKKGVTLVELLVVITILVILAMLLIGGMNFIAQVNKGADADRKADLNRIKIAFEDYFNDEGCYPDAVWISKLDNKDNCGTNIFSPWLNPWPCTTRGDPYRFVVENNSCPVWFIVTTDLEYENDSALIDGCGFEGCDVFSTSYVANYGVSSDNILWYEPVTCNVGCFQLTEEEVCQNADACTPPDCFTDPGCHGECEAVGGCGGG